MTKLLSDRLGLGPRELIAIVGAGGKTTIMGILAQELSSSGAKVITTTTTRMGADQVTEPVCWSDEPVVVDQDLVPGEPLFVLAGAAGNKVTGLDKVAVNELSLGTKADYIIVEADGARSLSVKAPAGHEPAIPQLATTVIVVIGADALVHPLGVVAHRLEQITTLTGLTDDDVLTPDAAATIQLHRNGGLKSIPDKAKAVMVITKVTSQNQTAAEALAALLEQHPRVDRCILLAGFQV